jgi:hypothetical protein
MNMYLGTSTFLPNFGPIGLEIWPPGAHLGKAVAPELMPGSSPDFNHLHLIRIHDIIPWFLI